MAILYKPFMSLRTVLYVSLAAFFLYITPVCAQSGPYTVENITVDVSADNAMNARNQAFEKAQQEALVALAANFLDGSQLAAFQPPPASTISPMVQDFEVTKEKLSKQRYIGTYTFRFKPNSVRQYFSHAAQQIAMPAGPSAPAHVMTGSITQPTVTSPLADLSRSLEFSRNLLILPFYKVGAQTLLWSGYNGWMQAWQRASLPSNQNIPIGDLTDVNDIGDNDALNYDQSKLNGMLTRYSAGEAAILIAEPDASLASVQSDTAQAMGVLKISIYRTDRNDGPEQAGQVSVAASGAETRSQLYDRAVRQVQQALLADWKSAAYIPPSHAAGINSTFEMRVPFSNLQEWAAAQRKLDNIQGINNVALKSLTPREARIGVTYEGDADTLRIALQQVGMDLSDPGFGVTNASIYDLYIRPRGPAEIIQPPSYQPLEPVQPLTGLGAPPEILPPDELHIAPPPPKDSYMNTF